MFNVGLTHLHRNGIIHRDLKSMNLLLCNGSKVAKITDLGVSRQLSEDTFLLKTLYGTPLYLSPEMCQGSVYNEKTDIWSLGVILYEMCALVTPFYGPSLLALACTIKDGIFNPIPSCYSKLMNNFIRWLLTPDFNKRPSVADISRQRQKFKVESTVALKNTSSKLQNDEDSVADTDSGCDEDSLDKGRRSKELIRAPVVETKSAGPSSIIQECGVALSKVRSLTAPFATDKVIQAKSVKENLSVNGNHLKNIDKKYRDPPVLLNNVQFVAPAVDTPQIVSSQGPEDNSLMVAINSDRVVSYMRRYGLTLRKLMDARVFNSKESAGGEEAVEAEIVKVNSIIRALDSAAKTGIISIKISKLLGMSNKTVVPPTQVNPPKMVSHLNDDTEEVEFQYRPGKGLHEIDCKKVSGNQAEIVQVLNYLQPSRPTNEPFKANDVVHKIFSTSAAGSAPAVNRASIDLVSPIRASPYSGNKVKCM